METPLDAERLAAAKGRFAAFFRELSTAFAEREDVLAQIALSLLAREHVLFAGPPGTAKSALVGAVIGRIFDEETGRPSLYARQLTESTVQTDVIGPIDFKTLMDTGRTEHFTDEGLLGAVHAFLDEVFDGRDMLLRSTLNLLHERELKQGTQITRGRFEVAFMTTNRYIAEVLESARETLLAFVDRVAFIGFVPRGFADPARLAEVLRNEVGGAGRAPLEASLSVQDLDALQAAVDAVLIPSPVCDGLAKLLGLLEAELFAAERADPAFVPTRYLSTRTAVRSGKILRAICVYDSIFRRPERELYVEPEDLRLLRLHLLLSGPTPEQAAVLHGRERDPREKRQLAILRAEREAFDRAYAKLPAIKIPPDFKGPTLGRAPAQAPPRSTPSPAPKAASPSPGASSAPAPSASPSSSPPPSAPPEDAPSAGDQREWAKGVAEAIVSKKPAEIARALRELVPRTRGSGDEALLAESMFRAALSALQREAVHALLDARTADDAGSLTIARDVALLADALALGPSSAQALARWVRGHALLLVGAAAPRALGLGHASAVGWASDRDTAALLAEVDAQLRTLEQLDDQRHRLVAAGVDPALRHEADAAWRRSLDGITSEVTALSDGALRAAATATLEAGPGRALSELLTDVGAALSKLFEVDRRANAVGLRTSFETTVVGPRLAPLLEHTFGRVEAHDRAAYLVEVDRAWTLLSRAGLAEAIPAAHWLAWASRALLRADAHVAEGPLPPLTLDGYRALRAAAPRVPSGYVLAEVALRTAPATLPTQANAPDVPITSELLAGLSPDLRRDVGASDERRVDRVIAFLEAYWGALDGGAEPSSPDAAAAELRRLVASRIFAILLDEGALSRTLLEIDLLRDLFPERSAAASELKARLEGLAERARARLVALALARGEASWNAALRKAAGAGAST